MKRLSAPPPPESVRERVISKDGLLYWNQDKVTDKRQMHDNPIRLFNDARPTVRIDRRMYDLKRLNYWIHTGEWPECVLAKDHNKSNWHFDNLMPATAQQSNFHRQFEKRTYSIIERITKTGKRYYYAHLKMHGKSYAFGKFDTEEEAIEKAITARKIIHGEYIANDLYRDFLKLIK